MAVHTLYLGVYVHVCNVVVVVAKSAAITSKTTITTLLYNQRVHFNSVWHETNLFNKPVSQIYQHTLTLQENVSVNKKVFLINSLFFYFKSNFGFVGVKDIL